MHRQLEAIVAQLQAARGRLHALADRTSADRWARRADPNRWSVGECVVHLNLTSEAYLPLIRGVLGDASLPPHAGSYRRDAFGFLLGYLVGPVPKVMRRRMRFATPASFVPKGDAPKETTLAEFDRLQGELIVLARASEGKAIHRARITSPFDARATYSVYSAFTIIPRHQQRHIIQAEEVWDDAAATGPTHTRP